MGALVPLLKPVHVECGGLDIVATEADRSERGLRASVHVSNGAPLFAQVVFLLDVDAQAAFVRRMQANGVAEEETQGCLPVFAALVEEALREAIARPAAPEGEDEGDDVHVEDWPAPLGEEALYGLPGAIVQAVEPHTEADPAALLITTLLCAGSMLGRAPAARAVGRRHGLNLNAVITGDTSKGRKGSSLGHLMDLFERVDPTWAEERVVSGLSSGEGLIAAVRDPSSAQDKDGNPVDAGVTDKRLMVIEEEFAATLKVMTREANILSATVRQAWDHGNLSVMTRNNPLHARAAHISILGHVTQIDALRYLSATDAGNGFANRFLWTCARRSKLLPDGGGIPNVTEAVTWLHDVQDVARRMDAPITRDAEAGDLWREQYGILSAGRPGMLGVVTSRAEAQVLRLSALYAVLDFSSVIKLPHLRAALEVWRYCFDSARWIFGEHMGANDSDRILDALREAGADGLSRTEIIGLFGRHAARGRIDAALRTLLTGNAIVRTECPRADGRPGRPRVVYTLREGQDHEES